MFELLRFNTYFEKMELYAAANYNTAQTSIIKLSLIDFKKLQTREYEFRYQGKMYDVVAMHRDIDSITLTCIQDKFEDNLFEHLETFFENFEPTTQTNQLQFLLAKIITLQFLKTEFQIVEPIVLFSYISLGHRTSLLLRFHPVELPPPRSELT